MILTADLNEINVTEILWFLLKFEKTGVLKVSFNDNQSRYFLREGNIESVENPYPELRLGNMLLGRGLIDEKWLERALKQQKELRKQLGEIFIQLNIITRDHLTRILKNQFEEIFLWLSEEKDAKLEFARFPEEEFITSNIFSKGRGTFARLILTINARINAYKEILRKLPDSASYLTVINREKLNPQVLRKEEYRQIIKLADGTRSLLQIRRACRYSTLKTGEAMLKLYDAKVLSVIEESL